MDSIIAKTLAKDEKAIKEITFSSRFLNIFMVIAFIKWLIIFGIVSLLIFASVRWRNYAPPIDLSMVGINWQSRTNPLETSLEEELSDNFSNKNLLDQVWVYPLIFFLMIVVPILFVYYQYYVRVANRYLLTERRIIFKRGWLSTEIESIHYDRITDVLVKQTIWEKFIFHTGKIYVSTAGREGYEAEMLNIANPHKIKKEVYDLKEKYREQSLNAIRKET